MERREVLFLTGIAVTSSLSGCVSQPEENQENQDMVDFNPTWHTIQGPENDTRSDPPELNFALIPELGVTVFISWDWISTGGGTGISITPISDLSDEWANNDGY
jgi:hypothetical protein